MSETEALGSEGVEEAEVDSEAGAPAPEAEQPEVEAQPEYDFLDIDDTFADKYVRLKVDGEETPVKLTEALQGFNREAVSTKRFQEAAKLREEAEYGLRIQQALETNPEMTLQILAQQAGLTPAQYIQQQQDAAEDDDEYADPLERALAQERQRVSALEERLDAEAADRQLRQAIDGLQQRYSVNDADTRQVVQTALKMGVGPEAFDMIYQSLAYQKMVGQQQATEQHTAAQQEAEQKRLAAKQQAAAAIGSGASAANTTTVPTADGNMSLREAFESAWDQAVGR